MTNHTFVLKDEKAFASGAFENTAYADGALRLEQYAGRYVQAGCYTTPEISAPAFNALVASWNAATPAGTAVELAVRVFAAGAWDRLDAPTARSPFLRAPSLPVQHPEDAAAYLGYRPWSMYVRPAVLLCSSSGPAFIQTTCAVPPPYICLPPPYVPRAGSGKRAKRFSTGASLFPLILSSSGTRASALSSVAPPRSPC